jgi:hypothetical protein
VGGAPARPSGHLKPRHGGHPRAARADGTPTAALPELPTFDGFTDLIGLPEIRELEKRFGTP